jgi:hypothetical protein
MKTLSTLSLGALLTLTAIGSAYAEEPAVLESARANQLIEVQQVTVRDGATTGVLVNRGDTPIENVRLVVQEDYRWPNEFKPGKNDPGSASEFTVAGPIEPRASEAFSISDGPPATPAKGGRFVTQIEVLQFDQVLPPS